MRAVCYHRYGSPTEVMALKDVPDPPPPGAGEVTVAVRAAVVASGDWRMTVADPFAARLYQGLWRIKRPVLGHGIAGVVEAVGPGVVTLAPGDAVFGELVDAGGFAERAAAPAARLAKKPAEVDFDVAAATPVAGFTALQAVRDHCGVTAGARVLVIGAGGAVGGFATTLAARLGGHVTAVDGAAKEAHARAAGAAEFVDRRRFDLAQSAPFDAIVDAVGSLPWRACRRALSPAGRYVAVAGPLNRTARLSLLGGRRMKGMIARPNPADLEQLRAWLADGTLRPTIAARYPLEATPEALARYGRGGTVGALVVVP